MIFCTQTKMACLVLPILHENFPPARPVWWVGCCPFPLPVKRLVCRHRPFRFYHLCQALAAEIEPQHPVQPELHEAAAKCHLSCLYMRAWNVRPLIYLRTSSSKQYLALYMTTVSLYFLSSAHLYALHDHRQVVIDK